MKSFSPVDFVWWIAGVMFSHIGMTVGAVTGPVLAWLLPWFQSDLFKLLLGGCFSVFGICLGKVVEVEWKDRVARRKERARKARWGSTG